MNFLGRMGQSLVLVIAALALPCAVAADKVEVPTIGDGKVVFATGLVTAQAISEQRPPAGKKRQDQQSQANAKQGRELADSEWIYAEDEAHIGTEAPPPPKRELADSDWIYAEDEALTGKNENPEDEPRRELADSDWIYAEDEVHTGSRVPQVRGVKRALASSDWIYAEDEIRTGSKGSAQVVMRDHGMLAMQANTRVVVTQYRFEQDNPGGDAMVAQVVSGSVRALTGLVGKREPRRLVLQTPLAAIGVLGTAVRVDVANDGTEQIIFDIGEGFVRTRAGRVAVKQGWGVRIVSADKLPQLFEPAKDPTDPAQLALELAQTTPEKARARVTEIVTHLDDGGRILLLGMLEQAHASQPETVVAITDSLLGASANLQGALMRTEVMLAPQRAADVLRSAHRAGADARLALGEVLGALVEPAPQIVEQVIDTSVDLGLDRQSAEQVLQGVRQAAPCRR